MLVLREIHFVSYCQVLQSVNPIKPEEVVLGQYDGYKDDPTVPNDSNTPTFASVVLRVHNERWEGISVTHMTTSLHVEKYITGV
jgi:glucose-6-phosphate 1-dehydrogenase